MHSTAVLAASRLRFGMPDLSSVSESSCSQRTQHGCDSVGKIGITVSAVNLKSTMAWQLIHRLLPALLLATLSHSGARAQEALRVAIGQRGGWEQSVSELGQSKG